MAKTLWVDITLAVAVGPKDYIAAIAVVSRLPVEVIYLTDSKSFRMMNHIHTKNIFQAQFKIQKVSLSRFNIQHCSCRVEYVWYQVFYSLLLAAISFYPLYLFFFPVCLKASAPPTSFPTGKHIYSWLVSHDILSTNQNKNSHTAVEDSFWRSFSDHTAQSPHCLINYHAISSAINQPFTG